MDLLGAGYMLRCEDAPAVELNVAAWRGTERPRHLRLVNDRDAVKTVELDGGFTRSKRGYSLFEVELDGERLAEIFYKREPAAK